MEKPWIETIRVRSSAAALEKAITILNEEITILNRSKHVQGAYCMQHQVYNGDMIISIAWESHISPQKTREGLMLAEQMMQLGSVDHAVWTQIAT